MPVETITVTDSFSHFHNFEASIQSDVAIYHEVSHQLEYETVEEAVTRIIEKQQMEEAFFVINLSDVIKKFIKWKRFLPRVETFYAVKCNPDQAILRTLASLGSKFDCASMGEIDAVLALPNVTADDVIYANPVKQRKHIKYAAAKGVELMTFDNLEELAKVKELHPRAKLVLRIVTDDSQSVCQLSSKYGAPLSVCPSLLDAAAQLGLDVVGVSFHVGSGCRNVSAFVQAIENARTVFDMAAQRNFKMNILDIGGGFPGSDEADHPTFEAIAEAICPTLDALFPTTRIIAEPGRYFVASAGTLVANVFARKEVAVLPTPPPLAPGHDASEELMEEFPTQNYVYYINDGVYGSFNCLLYDHAVAKPSPLAPRSADLFKCTIFGPTCDGLDCIAKNKLLPLLNIGDWVYFKDMGAYTLAASSTFNGFATPSVFYVNHN